MAYTPAIEELIEALQMLPNVGSRTAQRMVLQLLERDVESAQRLSKALQTALECVRKCPSCRTLTEQELCSVCADDIRDRSMLCVVSSDVDRAGIEMSGQFTGHYHVLHGVLSPIDHIGPQELGIFDLVDRVQTQSVSEVILALDSEIESEATAQYIASQLKQVDCKITRIPFSEMKSGNLDRTDTHVIRSAFNRKQEFSFERD